MRIIHKGEDYEILSAQGLNYRTDFTPDAIVPEISTHFPILYHHYDQHWFVKVGDDIREIRYKKSIFGFRYYDDKGNLSPYWTAVFCQMEGEEEDVVILGHYYQCRNSDYWDSLSPFADVPSGRWDFHSSYPRIFGKSKDHFPRYGEKPDLKRVDMERYGCRKGAKEYIFDYIKFTSDSTNSYIITPLEEK